MKRLLCLLLISSQPYVAGFSSRKKVAGIDHECRRLEAGLRGASAFIFAGPDPWTELTTVPAALTGGSLAYVYTEGTLIRWVFLREIGEDKSWFQDTNYYFSTAGALIKRRRDLSAFKSNINLQVTEYYDQGELVKQTTHHHPFGLGHEDSSQFQDHDAPLYLSVEDLPFGADVELRTRLARSGFIQREAGAEITQRLQLGRASVRRILARDEGE